MQDRYVGDIGDFGKYGLLRELFGRPEEPGSGSGLRLGVAWYLFPDEKDKPDGNRTSYLSNPTSKDLILSKCDDELYAKLHRLVEEEECRKVIRIQESGILPQNTRYYDQCLSYDFRQPRFSRETALREWLHEALDATRAADVVFVDPDNGITEKPIQFRKHGPKYVFMEDLGQFHERGQSLVVYHHLARWDTAENQIRYYAGRLKKRLNLSHLPWALWYHRGTARVYFIVPRDEHRTELGQRLNSFEDSPWIKQGHFQRVV